jgi:hypothetical protein
MIRVEHKNNEEIKQQIADEYGWPVEYPHRNKPYNILHRVALGHEIEQVALEVLSDFSKDSLGDVCALGAEAGFLAKMPSGNYPKGSAIRELIKHARRCMRIEQCVRGMVALAKRGKQCGIVGRTKGTRAWLTYHGLRASTREGLKTR